MKVISRSLIAAILILCCSSQSSSQWIQSNTQFGSDVTCLATAGSILYAGTSANGVFTSADSGVTWTEMNNGLLSRGVQAIAVNGASVFAGTTDGVFLLTNNGGWWMQLTSGLANTHINCLLQAGSNLYAGTDAGVFVSWNNGVDWMAVNNGLPNLGNGLPSIQALAISGKVLLAATWNRLYASSVDQFQWSVANAGVDGQSIKGVYPLAANVDHMYVGTSSGLYVSSDQGKSWAVTNTGQTGSQQPAIGSLTVFGSYVVAGAAGAAGLFISPDDGVTWKTDAAIAQSQLQPLCSAILGATLYIGTESGVWKRRVSEIVPPPSILAPLLLQPKNGAVETPTIPTLTWNPASGALSYRVQVSWNASFTHVPVDKRGLTATSLKLGFIFNGTTVYWRVSATNGTDTSAWSSVYSFTTAWWPLTTSPVAAWPANGAVDVSMHPTLRWNALNDAVAYTFQLSPSPAFDRMLYNWIDLPLTEASLSGLAGGTTYYWRLSATNGAGEGRWSPTQRFTTTAGAQAIAGTVLYDNAGALPVRRATVTLASDTGVVASAVSTDDGTFTFNDISSGTYTLTAAKAGEWVGANATDGLQIMRAFAGLAQFDSLQQRAADVNASESFNATDALLIIQRYAGIIGSFLRGEWVFDQKPLAVASTNITGLVIRGLAVGDVNKSSMPLMK